MSFTPPLKVLEYRAHPARPLCTPCAERMGWAARAGAVWHMGYCAACNANAPVAAGFHWDWVGKRMARKTRFITVDDASPP